jgi:hypothetical protein
VSEPGTSEYPPEDIVIDGEEERSSAIMLFTMLILTVGFSFSSMLLMNQSLQVQSAEGTPIFALADMIEKGKSLAARPILAETDMDSGSAVLSSPIADIKQIVMSQTSSDKIKWPRLRMTGFGISSDGTESFAIINGDLVHPGEFAGKVQLVEVRAHDVVVEYKGERKLLTVGLED